MNLGVQIISDMLLNRGTITLRRLTSAMGSIRLVPSQSSVRFLTIKDKAKAELEANKLLDDLYEEVRAQRFSEIVVIQTMFDADPRYFILANAFNPRHLLAGTETINKHYKMHMRSESQSFANLSLSQEWNVLDFHSVVVHLFSEKCRKHFDIDQLWAVGEKHDAKCQQITSKKAQAERLQRQPQ